MTLAVANARGWLDYDAASSMMSSPCLSGLDFFIGLPPEIPGRRVATMMPLSTGRALRALPTTARKRLYDAAPRSPTVNTGTGEVRTTRSAVLPMIARGKPCRPCVPITISRRRRCGLRPGSR
jgi:hypothetical protein